VAAATAPLATKVGGFVGGFGRHVANCGCNYVFCLLFDLRLLWLQNALHGVMILANFKVYYDAPPHH